MAPTVKDRERAVDSCLKILAFNHVPCEGVFIKRGSYGIGTWAAIDCLVNYHNFTLVAELPKPKSKKSNVGLKEKTQGEDNG
jgi:hypothetical protein